MNTPRFGSSVWILPLACLLLSAPLLAQEGDADPEAQGEKISQTVTTSLTQAIQGESGISVQTMCTNCNSADLSVGAFSNEFISMLCDGLPVPSGLAQIYLLAVIPPSVIDNIAVEKGPGSALLKGGAIGGEIDIRRKAPEDGLQVNATADVGGYGWRGARADIAGRTGWFGGDIVATWATSDPVDADEDLNPDMAGFDRTTFEGRLDLRPGDKHRILIGAADYDESQYDGRAGFDLTSSQLYDYPLWNKEDVQIERQQYDLSYKLDLKDGANLTTALMVADRETKIEEEQGALSDVYQPTYDITEEYGFVSLAWFQPLGYRASLRMGGSLTDENYAVLDRAFNRLQRLPDGFLLEENPSELGFWAEGEITLSGKLNLFAGLRYAKFDYEDNMQEIVDLSFVSDQWLDVPLPQGDKWLPRLALNWKPVDPLNVRFTYGQGYRQPPATFEEVCCGRLYRGNRGTEMEESEVYGFEITYQPAPKYQLNVSAFRTDFDNLVVKLASWVDRYIPTYQNSSMPKARYDSAALEFRWDAAKWASLRVGGTWTDPQNLTEDGEIPVLRDRFGRPELVSLFTEQVPYVSEYTGNLSVQFQHQESRTSFGFTVQLTGPQLIQQFPQDGLPDTFVPTESFEIYNFNVAKRFGESFEIFAGVDNIGEYLEATIADPRTDYTWGPLRGIYYYGGVTYRFAGL